MSVTEHPVPTPDAAVLMAPSFKEKLAKCREALAANLSFELEVPGYDGLWARYRVLGFDEMRRVGIQIEQEVDDQVTAERLTAAASLATACEELMEFKGTDAAGKPVFEATGHRWTLQTAREMFGVDLPDGVAPREVMLAIFPYPRDMLLVTHFNDYIARAMNFLPGLDEAIQGELRAASAAT